MNQLATYLTTNPFEAAVIAAAVWGYAYNMVNAWMDARGYNDYFVAFSVALGCLVTILISGVVIGAENMLVVLSLFAAAGISMIAGSTFRVVARIRERQERLKADARAQSKRNREEMHVTTEPLEGGASRVQNLGERSAGDRESTGGDPGEPGHALGRRS